MSTVKISQLPLLTSLNANTANSLFMGVDLPTGTTGKFTAHTLAQGLFSNEILAVGTIQQNLPNTVAQFSQSGESYIQTNLVNTNDGGTADIVVTANTGSGGTDAANFIDMGWANKNYQPGSEFNNIGNAVNPNDGYLYAQGTSGQPYGNLIIGTTSTTGQLKFIAGGGQASNVVAKMTSTGLTLNTQSYITFADGSTQNVAYNPGTETTQNTRLNSIETINTSQNTSINVIQGVDLTQNTLIAIIQGVDTTQNTNITAANNTAWLAFDLANAANTLANTAAANASYGLWRMDITTLINITQNNRIAQAESNCVTLFGYTTQSGVINAGQNTSINLAWTTANNALANIPGVTTAGSLNVSGTVNSQKGFVYSPTVYPGAQTAITIDVSNNSLVRAQTSTGLVITLSNLMAGKEVISWITNTANSAQTFTHGCSALNSTVNSTTYNIPSTSTILVRYMCIDTTAQNTFVAITKA